MNRVVFRANKMCKNMTGVISWWQLMTLVVFMIVALWAVHINAASNSEFSAFRSMTYERLKTIDSKLFEILREVRRK